LLMRGSSVICIVLRCREWLAYCVGSSSLSAPLRFAHQRPTTTTTTTTAAATTTTTTATTTTTTITTTTKTTINQQNEHKKLNKNKQDVARAALTPTRRRSPWSPSTAGSSSTHRQSSPRAYGISLVVTLRHHALHCVRCDYCVVKSTTARCRSWSVEKCMHGTARTSVVTQLLPSRLHRQRRQSTARGGDARLTHTLLLHAHRRVARALLCTRRRGCCRRRRRRRRCCCRLLRRRGCARYIRALRELLNEHLELKIRQPSLDISESAIMVALVDLLDSGHGL
jgi:hypothetical protein